jgi:hypothetical protein
MAAIRTRGLALNPADELLVAGCWPLAGHHDHGPCISAQAHAVCSH